MCFPGSGPPERGGAAGQSSEDAKFYRARRVGCHLHADKNCGIFTLTRGKTTLNKRHNSLKIELFTLYQTPLYGWRLWSHFIIHITDVEFHGGREFNPTEAYCGQVLEQMENITCLSTKNLHCSLLDRSMFM